jgi:hypothetical protein
LWVGGGSKVSQRRRRRRRREGVTGASTEVGDQCMAGASGGLAAAVHQFYVKHKSARSIYNECCDLGYINDMLISGGLHAM